MEESSSKSGIGDAAEGSSAWTLREVNRFRHDARNQLNLIIGYIDLLDRPSAGPLNARQKAYVARVRSAAASLDELVDNLLRQTDIPNTETAR